MAMQKVVAGTRIAVVVIVTLTSVLTLLQPSTSFTHNETIEMSNLGTYQDNASKQSLSSLNWEALRPDTALNKTNYVNNTGKAATQEKAMSTSSIEETFDFLNSAVWKISNYTVSYGRFNPANVVVSNGMLQLSVPTGLTEGGQIYTLGRFLYNRFGCRMKTNGVANTCTSLFTYYSKPGAVGSDQIAIEIYGDQPDQMYVTTWKLGKPSNDHQRTIVNLGFNSNEAFHDYEIAWFPDHVDIYVDGILRASLTDANYLPTQPQRFLLTCFNTSWKGPAPVAATASFESVWIRRARMRTTTVPRIR